MHVHMGVGLLRRHIPRNSVRPCLGLSALLAAPRVRTAPHQLDSNHLSLWFFLRSVQSSALLVKLLTVPLEESGSIPTLSNFLRKLRFLTP